MKYSKDKLEQCSGSSVNILQRERKRSRESERGTALYICVSTKVC